VPKDIKEFAYNILSADGIECVFLENSFVPLCDEDCKQHDGKRCKILGGRPSINCEPACEVLCEIGLKYLHVEQNKPQ
jgi:hypothetical protein